MGYIQIYSNRNEVPEKCKHCDKLDTVIDTDGNVVGFHCLVAAECKKDNDIK